MGVNEIITGRRRQNYHKQHAAVSSMGRLGITESDSFIHKAGQRKFLKRNRLIFWFLCDIEMPMGTGIELIEWMHKEVPVPRSDNLLTRHSESIC